MFDAKEIRQLPADVLAYRALPSLPDRAFRRTFEINALGGGTALTIESRNLAAALQVLVNDGVLVPWPPTDSQYETQGQGDMLMLTAWGARVKKAGNKGRAMTRAQRRLGVDLHPKLQAKLRDLIAVGAFESAALDALRAIEARVRTLAEIQPKPGKAKLTGVPLMETAFGEKGPLTDPDVDRGEQQGEMNLFKGAFGAIRNVLAHTDEVQWSDSIEAAEYVLLADLLMRRLDHAERRKNVRQLKRAANDLFRSATELGRYGADAESDTEDAGSGPS